MAADPLWMTRRNPMHPYVEREQHNIIQEMGLGKGIWTHEQILEREREYVRRMAEVFSRLDAMKTQSSDNVPTVNIEDEPVWSDDESSTLENLEQEVENEVVYQVRNTAASA